MSIFNGSDTTVDSSRFIRLPDQTMSSLNTTWLLLYLKKNFARLPERSGCLWRDQCHGHQQVSDLSLDRLWTEDPYTPGSLARQLGGLQAAPQGGLVWPVCTPQEHFTCECSLLAGQ